MRFRNRKGQGLEAVFYELQPFVYLGLALYVMFFKNSNKFAVGFALILLCCAGAILNWRYQNRR
jgi:lipoprotein signal peptidase